MCYYASVQLILFLFLCYYDFVQDTPSLSSYNVQEAYEKMHGQGQHGEPRTKAARKRQNCFLSTAPRSPPLPLWSPCPRWGVRDQRSYGPVIWCTIAVCYAMLFANIQVVSYPQIYYSYIITLDCIVPTYISETYNLPLNAVTCSYFVDLEDVNTMSFFLIICNFQSCLSVKCDLNSSVLYHMVLWYKKYFIYLYILYKYIFRWNRTFFDRSSSSALLCVCVLLYYISQP